MDPRFDDIANQPENRIFQIVTYPDRIYHAQYLNATVSDRYRYNVREVRDRHDVTVAKGDVFLDGEFLTRFLRIEYRASRLVETTRECNRFINHSLQGWLRLIHPDNNDYVETNVTLHYCRWIDAYQVEIWQTLEAPSNRAHDVRVRAMMGFDGSITREKKFSSIMEKLEKLNECQLAFGEQNKDPYSGFKTGKPEWDNNYHNTYQAPNNPQPSHKNNTVYEANYTIMFQRGWYMRSTDVKPVCYDSPLMENKLPDNIVEMRWLLQRELGGKLIYFHEVTLPPGTVEGAHRHIGSEEVYYITQGEGIAYMGDHDDPDLSQQQEEDVEIFLLGKKHCRRLNVKSGDMIYTKSGGIHGIKNPSPDTPLVFVAFAYHTR